MRELSRFPLLAAYLEKLPNGLDSHPSCLAKGSMLRADLGPDALEVPRGLLPEPIERLLSDPPLPTQWIPEVHNVAAHLASYELRFGRDQEATARHVYAANRALVESPLYKGLFTVPSPTLLVRGAERRWAHLHRGVSIDVTISADRKAGVFTLKYPDHLFSREWVEGIAVGLSALLEAHQTRGVRRRVVSWKRRQAIIEGTWETSWPNDERRTTLLRAPTADVSRVVVPGVPKLPRLTGRLDSSRGAANIQCEDDALDESASESPQPGS